LDLVAEPIDESDTKEMVHIACDNSLGLVAIPFVWFLGPHLDCLWRHALTEQQGLQAGETH
jgi:hypothetical protein